MDGCWVEVNRGFCRKDICGLADLPLLDPSEQGGPNQVAWLREQAKWKPYQHTGACLNEGEEEYSELQKETVVMFQI